MINPQPRSALINCPPLCLLALAAPRDLSDRLGDSGIDHPHHCTAAILTRSPRGFGALAVRLPLRVEVQGSYILVAMRGTCLMAKYRKQEAPWLAMDGYAEDSEAPMTFQEFRSLAWEAANEKARELGWVRSYDELHEAVKRAGAP